MTLRSLFLLPLLGLLLFACSPDYRQQAFPLEVVDSLGVLGPETRAALTAATYPEGLAFVIETQPLRGPAAFVGAQAEAAFEAAAARHAQPEAFAARGVLVLLTPDPPLVQVRTGDELRSLAQWQGLTAGPAYLHWQQKALAGDPDSALLGMTKMLRQRLPEATQLTGLRKWVYEDGLTFLGDEIGQLSLPSESFYSQSILKPMLRLHLTFHRWGLGWWGGYLLIFAGAWLLGRLLNKLLLTPLLRRQGKATQNLAAQVLQLLLGLLVGVPSAAGVLLLSGTRLEDQLAVQAMGLGTAELAGPLAPNAWAATPWWLALFAALGFLLLRLWQSGPLFEKAMLPELEQRQQFFALKTQDQLGHIALMWNLSDRSDDRHEAAAQQQQAPFSYWWNKYVMRSLLFTPLLGLFAGMLLPRAMTTALLCFTLMALLGGMLGSLISLIREARPPQAPAEAEAEKAQALLEQIGHCAQEGDTSGVYTRLQQVLALTGQLEPVHYYLNQYQEAENYAFAAELMHLCLDQEPWNAGYVHHLARLSRASGAVEAEMEQLARLHQLHEEVAPDPDIGYVLERWAQLLLSQRQYAPAAVRYAQLYARNHSPKVQAQWAVALLGAGEVESARAQAEAALAVDDQLALAWIVKGEIAAEYDQAMALACEAFRQARALGIQRPEIDAFLAQHQPQA